MTLKEVGIVIGKKLISRRKPFDKKQFIVSFESTEVKNGCLLISSYGEGKSVKQAKANYCRKLSGEILVMDALLKNRREIQLPPKITVR